MNRLYFRSSDRKTVRVVINVSAEHFIVFKLAPGYSTIKTWVGDFRKTRDSWNMVQYRPRVATRVKLDRRILEVFAEHTEFIFEPWVEADLVSKLPKERIKGGSLR